MVFVDASEDSIMADDVITPLNPLVASVKKEAPLDVNVFQRSHEKEPSKIVVCTRIDHLPWDRRLPFNPHALAIYLDFFLLMDPSQKGLKCHNPTLKKCEFRE